MNDWRAILETAIYAPSPHNVQPWRVRVLGEADAELLIEKRRTLPKEDVTGSFIILTMGLFVETLRLVAAHRGLALEVRLVHEPEWYRASQLESQADEVFPFARLVLRRDPAVRVEVPLALIRERRTSRLPYGPEPVAPEDAARLEAVACQWNQGYGQLVDRDRIDRLLGWNIGAVIEDLNHAPYHDELAGWMRYSRAASARHRDGLDARCMNVPPLELWAAFRWPGLLRWRPAVPWFRRRLRAQIGPVATLGYVSGPFWNPSDAYECGRFLTRFWLECTRLGYVLHPFGNLVTNRRAAARVAAELGVEATWLIFKIGRSAEPPRSHRRSVDEILLDAIPARSPHDGGAT